MMAISTPDSIYEPPPFLMYSSLSFDAEGNFKVEGGGTPVPNMTQSSLFSAIPMSNSSWTLSTNNGSWLTFDSRASELRNVPLYSLHAQAPEHDLVFHLNGILSDDSTKQVYLNMMVVNTRTKTVRIVSTESISSSDARIGAVLQYLPMLGRKGALVLFGGATRHQNNMISDPWGNMVVYPHFEYR
jgi:hypothetical protein